MWRMSRPGGLASIAAAVEWRAVGNEQGGNTHHCAAKRKEPPQESQS